MLAVFLKALRCSSHTSGGKTLWVNVMRVPYLEGLLMVKLCGTASPALGSLNCITSETAYSPW